MNLKRQKHTIFIYCEGKTDKLFAQHLKKLYINRGTKKINLKEGTGGDFFTFITEILKNPDSIGCNEKYILLDTNGKKSEELKESESKSEEHDISLIWQKPCLEGVFLRILEPKTSLTNKTSKQCKDIFYKKYIKHPPLTTAKLENLFPKDKLNKKRKDIPELDQLITIMEP